MRHLSRATAVLAVGVCAFALAAAPALAHEFLASHAGRTKGRSEGVQNFKLGPFKINCNNAKVSGSIPGVTSKTLFTRMQLKNCATKAEIGGEPITLKTVFRTPLDIEYYANRYVEIGSEEEEVEGSAKLAGGEVELYVPSVKCVITWEEQTIPGKAVNKPNAEYSEATFTNDEIVSHKLKKFPSGFQTKLRIENNFSKMKFEYSEGQCEEWKKPEEEFTKGHYIGELLEEMHEANLEYR